MSNYICDSSLAIMCLLYTIAVSGQECTDDVGSLSHDNKIVTAGQTFIFAGYTVPCNGTVVAWGVLLSEIHT